MSQVLIIEEDPHWRQFLSDTLGASHEISFWPDKTDVFRKLSAKDRSIVILDLHDCNS